MKHVTSYIFLIIAFLLLGVNGAAAQEEGCPFKVTVDENTATTISCDDANKVLSIKSSDKVTIEGDGTSTDWGIEIESRGRLSVTINDLNIQRAGVPLKINRGNACSIKIEGTNQFVSTGLSETAGIEIGSTISLHGSGSLTALGAEGIGDTPGGAGIGGGGSLTIGGGIIHAKGRAGAPGIGGDGASLIIYGGIIHAEGGAGAPGIGVSNPKGMTIQITGGTVTAIGGDGNGNKPAPGIDGGTSSNSTTIAGNAFVIAIDREDANEVIATITQIENHTKGLFIRGEQDSDGSIVWASSDLKGDITLESNAEIPDWATVTIAANQTFTIDAGVTLTNSGTIENEGTINNAGTIRNKGTLKGNSVEGNGKLYYVITFNANYPASPVPVEKDFLQGDALPTNIFTRSGYTFQGWYDDPDGGTKVETVTEPQTLYAHWKAVPVPEPDPEPAPTIYYTVTLPFVEGAATDPVAGDYDVESWSTFRFYLTIDTAYSQSQPVVTTSRGETLQPRTSDGAYLLKYVRTDVEVYIDGIEKNNPVANEPIRAADDLPEIWSENACLCIRLPEGLPMSPVRIFTAEGRLLDSFRSTPGLNRRQLPTGIYIVQVGATVRKVAIR